MAPVPFVLTIIATCTMRAQTKLVDVVGEYLLRISSQQMLLRETVEVGQGNMLREVPTAPEEARLPVGPGCLGG